MSKHFVAVDAPTIHHSRSRFDLSYDVKTSMSVGKLYPIYVQEIYPGDTFNTDTTLVTRLSSSYLRPVCDNLFLDVYYFFVPNRLVFDKWAQVFGENKQSAWVQPEAVFAPHTDGNETVYSKSVGDYLGLPVSEDQGDLPAGVNILPFRAFAKIYDEWFRDQNLIAPMYINTGDFDSEVEGLNGGPWSPSNYMGMLPSVSKFHDIFTSSLPSTQKAASPVRVPIIQSMAPVVSDGLEGMHRATRDGVAPHIRFNGDDGSNSWYNLMAGPTASSVTIQRPIVGLATSGSAAAQSISEWNLYADLAQAGQINVNDMRYAFQLQRILERSARCGTRYTEYLLGAFGVSSPDARLQRPEYLGGKRMPLSVQQVAQTTRGDSDSTELGSLGAFSLSNGKCGYEKAFVEHGFVIGTACIRQHHSYSQGVERFWQRKERFDYYDPILANISEVPVFRSEVYAKYDSTNQPDLTTGVFGYQEAWYDLRQRRSMISGDMRSTSPTSLDIWHYGDYYANAPTLNQQFITEIPDYVDRTISVPSTSLDQFIVDIYHKQSAIRVLPTYSIPGLVDHH